MAQEIKFFDLYNPTLVSTQNFDEKIIEDNRLKIIFLWGINCPNCEISKSVLSEYFDQAQKWDLDWYHANVYEDFELANRFGLHGIPVFLIYLGTKRLGKISPFPGWDAFSDAIGKLV